MFGARTLQSPMQLCSAVCVILRFVVKLNSGLRQTDRRTDRWTRGYSMTYRSKVASRDNKIVTS